MLKAAAAACQRGFGGPAARREPHFVPESVLSEEQWKEAVALMKLTTDEDTVKRMMKLTFDVRRNMVLDPQQWSSVLSVFPRFTDVTGLVRTSQLGKTSCVFVS